MSREVLLLDGSCRGLWDRCLYGSDGSLRLGLLDLLLLGLTGAWSWLLNVEKVVSGVVQSTGRVDALLAEIKVGALEALEASSGNARVAVITPRRVEREEVIFALNGDGRQLLHNGLGVKPMLGSYCSNSLNEWTPLFSEILKVVV